MMSRVHPNLAALTLNSVPRPPSWEKGLGDEGKHGKLGCTRLVQFLDQWSIRNVIYYFPAFEK